MRNTTDLITAYLLGDLDTQERAAVEEKLFADEAFFDRVEFIEDELVDAYVAGNMPPQERSAFERHFLQSKRRRDRVESAKLLSSHFGGRESLGTVPKVRRWWASNFLQAETGTARFVLAACLLAAVVIGLFIHFKGEKQSLLVAQRARIVEPAKQGTNSTASSAPVRLHPLAPSHSEPKSIPAFVLLPGVLRTVKHRVIAVPSNSDYVQLTLRSSIEITPGTYAVSLRRENGREVWKQNLTYAHTVSVTVKVPAHLLTAGQYTLTLTAVDSKGIREDLQDFAFDVAR